MGVRILQFFNYQVFIAILYLLIVKVSQANLLDRGMW